MIRKNSLWAPCSTLVLIAALACGLSNQSIAQVANWTNGAGAGTGDFFDGANWDIAAAPGAANIAIIDGGGTAIIDVAGTTAAGADVLSLQVGGALASGTSGNIVMNSGFFRTVGAASSDHSVIASQAGSTGSFIMNGGELHVGNVAGTSGLQGSVSGADLVFANSADTNGTFEMHGTAIYRGLDDLTLGNHNLSGPVGMAATSVSTFIMDGDSQASVGDGFNTRGILTMTMSDNAVMTLGNSMGAANPAGAWAEGSGYINIGSRGGSQANITVENNAVFNASRMQNNDGTSTITVRDNGEFNIFNTSTGGTEVDFKGQTYLNRATGSTTITLEGSGKFTVDSDPTTVNADGSDGHVDLLPQAGLTLVGGDDEPVQVQPGGGGNPGGNNYSGNATVLIDINDTSEFSIVQDLWMTYGTSSAGSSTVKVTGPGAIVSIGGDLNMAKAIVQEISNGVVTQGGLVDRPGTAEIHSVITGSTHSTIVVGDEARIDNGDLIVELSGYSPVLGDSFTLLTTGNGSGVLGEFNSVDETLAPLGAGLSWDVAYNPASVVLSVVPEPESCLLVLLAFASLGMIRRKSVK